MAYLALRRRASELSRVAALALLFGACGESPTGPANLVRSVGGTDWVAIPVPDQLPDDSVWRSNPPAEAFLDSFAALSSWTDRVRAEISHGEVEALDGVVTSVNRDVEIAAYALEQGDSAVAARHLSHAGEVVRSFGPDRVAAALLRRVEDSLASADLDRAYSRRAEHLIRAASDALREGDSMRALRRGLYALQLAAGRGIPLIECPAGEEGCDAP